MSETILKVRGLKKYFPVIAGILRRKVGDVKAVDGIDFTIYPGQVVGIVGESGCGKSTAGRASIRLIEPTAGQISFKGQDLMAMSPEELRNVRKQIQIVFQDPYAALNPRHPIIESVGAALLYHGIVKTRSEQRKRVGEVLERVGLSASAMDRYPHEFSGGQQQRLCIGRAIAMDPSLLILDEALSALDVSVQAQIINLLQELRSTMGLSYLFISHDLSVVRHVCDWVVVLYLGKVMESASVQELFENPKHPYTQALLSAIPRRNPQEIKQRIILKGEIPSPINPPSGCPFRTRCPYAQPICALPPPHRILRDRATGHDDHHYYCILE